jgi:acetyl-CoA C-acetyltransferase
LTASAAAKAGLFKEEIAPVTVKSRRGEQTFSEDEEPAKVATVPPSEADRRAQVKAEKIPGLRPAFQKDGTVTAANASSLNDGAAALVLASEAFANEKGAKPLARILGYADAARKPIEFTIAPADAIPLVPSPSPFL